MKSVNLFRNNRLIERFRSINECAQYLKVSPGWIRKILRYKHGSLPGKADLSLSYADPFDSLKGMRPTRDPMRVYIWSVNGEFISAAESLNQAAKMTYTRAGSVSAFLQGKLISVNGFVYSLDNRFPGLRPHRRRSSRLDSIAA